MTKKQMQQEQLDHEALEQERLDEEFEQEDEDFRPTWICNACGKILHTEIQQQIEQHLERCWMHLIDAELRTLAQVSDSGITEVQKKRAASKLRILKGLREEIGNKAVEGKRAPLQQTVAKRIWAAYRIQIHERGLTE